jgi:uncharacterized protein YutE (UPF0331/DUF86 family)
VSDKSPLFVSALELLAHATELFALNNTRKYKFVILHLANAIELVLKDCIIDQGQSIYEERGNRTINIWESFKKLKAEGIKIPERPVIELLIDDRNTIQHRFGYPDAETVWYYLEQVVAFFRRFLNDHYGVKLSEALEPHLSKEHLELLGLVEDEYGYLTKLLELSPEAAIVQAYSQVEELILEILFPASEPHLQRYPRLQFWRLPGFQKLLDYLENSHFVSKGIGKRFVVLRDARNRAAHSAVADISREEVQVAFDIARELISGLRKAKNAGYTIPPDVDDEGVSGSG